MQDPTATVPPDGFILWPYIAESFHSCPGVQMALVAAGNMLAVVLCLTLYAAWRVLAGYQACHSSAYKRTGA